MAETPENMEEAVLMVSSRLREWIHEVNNALFITKGFLEEISGEVEEKNYLQDSFDHENFIDMLQTVGRSVERIDQNLQKLRRFAKEEIFDGTGVTRPS
jgi:hypothetical protein